MSKIYLKYIPIDIQNFEHTSVIMNMKLSSHGSLFHRKKSRRENKGQITNESPITMRKKLRIYVWCAAKDNWASQISEEALTKELEPWQFILSPSGQ